MNECTVGNKRGEKMTIQQLSYFITLARYLHFGKAAKVLYIAQPALSHSIAALETELSVKLFDRDNRKVELTHAGRLFLQEAVEIVDRVENAVQKTKLAEAGHIGALRIGTLGGLCRSPVPEILQNFSQKHPQVSISMADNNSAGLIRHLTMGDVDLAVIWAVSLLPFKAQVAWHVLGRMQLSMVVSKHHRLADTAFDLNDLADDHFITLNSRITPAIHNFTLQLCDMYQFNPRVVYNAPTLEIACTLIKAGLGVGVFTTQGADKHSDGQLVCRPIGNGEHTLDVALAWSKSYTNPAVPFFLAEAGVTDIGRLEEDQRSSDGSQVM